MFLSFTILFQWISNHHLHHLRSKWFWHRRVLTQRCKANSGFTVSDRGHKPNIGFGLKSLKYSVESSQSAHDSKRLGCRLLSHTNLDKKVASLNAGTVTHTSPPVHWHNHYRLSVHALQEALYAFNGRVPQVWLSIPNMTYLSSLLSSGTPWLFSCKCTSADATLRADSFASLPTVRVCSTRFDLFERGHRHIHESDALTDTQISPTSSWR